jgi:hypothetical protein
LRQFQAFDMDCGVKSRQERPMNDPTPTKPEKPMAQDRKAGDDLLLRKPNFTNPVLLFLVIMIPMIAGIGYSFQDVTPPEVVSEPAPQIEAEMPPPIPDTTATAKPMMDPALNPLRGSRRPVGGDISAAGAVGECRFNYLVGMMADENVAQSLKQRRVQYRILPPGAMMTMDHSPSRLNLEVDDQGVIRRAWCG